MSEASIVIIDDEPGIVKLCQRLLERANFKVEAFTDSIKGIEHIKQEKFDLLLVDIRMPGMDGFQVIEETRKNQPDMAVVIMTGFGTLETAIRALKQGADGLILKPFEEGAELLSTVKDALKERRQKQELARLEAIRPLLDVTEKLFSETRYETLLDLIINAIRGHLRCNHAAIYIREPGENYLSLLISKGNPLPEDHSRAKSGIIGRTDHWKVPIWINRGAYGDEDLQEILEEFTLGAVICIPISRGEGSLVFMAGRDLDEPGFQMADLEMFGLLARQADVALENARLYGELREYVNQVENSQRALIQAEKMAAVGRLTASIAHEVNNPLQAVQNCLHLAGREELSEEERENYMIMAEEELDRLMGTVHRMLDFYRPGALDRKPTQVNELIERVLALLEKQLLENDIVIDQSLTDNLPDVVVVSNQIQQVIFNILLNSMYAMPKGGNINIESNSENSYVEILFQDNGPGIPNELAENIFEPFMSTRNEGTGLGLSVSYGILTAHGGSLELVSGNEQGACFRMTLPVKELT